MSQSEYFEIVGRLAALEEAVGALLGGGGILVEDAERMHSLIVNGRRAATTGDYRPPLSPDENPYRQEAMMRQMAEDAPSKGRRAR